MTEGTSRKFLKALPPTLVTLAPVPLLPLSLVLSPKGGGRSQQAEHEWNAPQDGGAEADIASVKTQAGCNPDF